MLMMGVTAMSFSQVGGRSAVRMCNLGLPPRLNGRIDLFIPKLLFPPCHKAFS